MPNLIDLRRRIKSVKNTQQITKAMKTVSTAKFRKAQRGVLEGRPLWHEAPGVLSQISAWAGAGAHPLFAVRAEKRVRVIVLTSDKGLCGAFNSNLMSKALQFIQAKAAGAEVKLVLIGKKASNFFKKQPFPIEKAYADKTDCLGDADFAELAESLGQAFTFQETDAVYIIYNEFKSVLAPRIMTVRLLPVARAAAAPGHGQRLEERRGADRRPRPRPEQDSPGEHHQGAPRDHLGRRGDQRVTKAVGVTHD